ncbi:MAG: sugar-binding domain-containing protein, partial [Victivallales bacterium]
KELLISNNEKWLNAGDRVIAFNASGDFQDLPNYDLSPQIEKVIRDGATSRVILKRPLTKLYPSGTPVRLHSPYGAPFYWVASGWMPAEWKQFSTAMSGESQSGTPSDKFWRGTKYVRVFVWFANYDKIPKEDARLLVDDITFVCRDQTVAEKIIEQQWGKYVAGQQVLAAICRTPKRTIEIDRQWSFATDAQDEGLMSGWMRTDFADQGWPLIDADHWWQDQGYPDYHGVAWYRRTVPPFTLEKGQKCFIHFGAVDGDACVFVNGRKVGERNLGFGGREWDSPLYFEITEDLAVGKQNVIAVRVKKNEYKSGIYKGVKIIHINNIGKGE